jgi:methionyl-tRNA formyltransferase
MRLVFAGTPVFAQVALRALLQAGHEIALVMTQPDRPAGRGLQIRPSPVKALALDLPLPLAQPSTLRSEGTRALLAATNARALVVAAYGLLLPPHLLELFPLGCINIHASLLPRWRGAAPIQRALLAGDSQTGISIMRMDAGLDTGPLLLTRSTQISARETAQSLHDRLAAIGAECIVEALEGLGAGRLEPRAQPLEGVTYARKVDKREAELDWCRSAVELDRQVRAFDPYPVATTHLRGALVRVWRSIPVAGPSGSPGTVARITREGLLVRCGEGLLRLEEVQRAGGRRLPAQTLARGLDVQPGERLGLE